MSLKELRGIQSSKYIEEFSSVPNKLSQPLNVGAIFFSRVFLHLETQQPCEIRLEYWRR